MRSTRTWIRGRHHFLCHIQHRRSLRYSRLGVSSAVIRHEHAGKSNKARLPLQAQRMPLRAEAQRARTVQMGGAAPYPYDFITIEPTYMINDPEAVQEIMLEYVTRSKSELTKAEKALAAVKGSEAWKWADLQDKEELKNKCEPMIREAQYQLDKIKKQGKSPVEGGDRITLLRDSDGDGQTDLQTTFIDGLDAPYGLALVDARYTWPTRIIWSVSNTHKALPA